MTRLNLTQPDLVDSEVIVSSRLDQTGADIDMLLLPLGSADYLQQTRTSSEAVAEQHHQRCAG